MPSVSTTTCCRFFAPVCCAIAAAAAQGGTTDVPSAPRWTVQLESAPAAPPLLDDGRVVVALDAGSLVAFDLADGHELWRREQEVSLPIAADGGRVIVASRAGLAAINADGSPAWQRPLGAIAAPPLAQDGWVIAASAGELVAVRTSDGSIVWRVPADRVSAQVAIEARTVYVPFEDGHVRALDLEHGRTRWARRLGGAATEVLPFPDRVFVGSADKSFYALDAEDGEIAWRTRVGAALRGRPVSDGVRVFVLALDHALRAYDRASGALLWSPKGVPFRPAAGPALAGGLVFVAGPAVEVRLFEGATGKPRTPIKLAQPVVTVPAFAASPAGVLMAVVTGTLAGRWELALWVPSSAPEKSS